MKYFRFVALALRNNLVVLECSRPRGPRNTNICAQITEGLDNIRTCGKIYPGSVQMTTRSLKNFLLVVLGDMRCARLPAECVERTWLQPSSRIRILQSEKISHVYVTTLPNLNMMYMKFTSDD